MTDLRKAAEMALEALNEVTGWQWSGPMRVMDEVEDAIQALRQALAHPEQESVKCMYPYCETASGCDGPCSKPLTTPVDAVNMSQKRVDETAKREHEPVAYVSDSGSIAVMVAGTDFDDDTPLYISSVCANCVAGTKKHKHEPIAWMFRNQQTKDVFFFDSNTTKEWFEKTNNCIGSAISLYEAPPNRQWVELTDGEIYKVLNMETNDAIKIARAIEAKLKEKNT